MLIPQSRCQVCSAFEDPSTPFINFSRRPLGVIPFPFQMCKCQYRSSMHSRRTRHTHRCARRTRTRELQRYSPSRWRGDGGNVFQLGSCDTSPVGEDSGRFRLLGRAQRPSLVTCQWESPRVRVTDPLGSGCVGPRRWSAVAGGL